ncbi:response regulator transcription factor [Acrocarpospora catenulata]|uniref:response regulator transcription factor n=1 Tax=Acrocarpospora catenulata TaxID=2836182 RepID=UPI0027E2066E|nr:response regulator transcription factor [Acrocarpospora catenulata]
MDRELLDRPVTLAVVEDLPVVIEGMRSWVAQDPHQRVEIVASGNTLEAVLAGAGADADVLLLDLELNGVLMIGRIPELAAQGRRVVVYSVHEDEETILTVLKAGAVTFISKNETADHCLDTILAAAGDRPYVTPTMAGALVVADARTTRPMLSAREREALLLWFQGMNKQSVATRMGISEATVKQYIERARIKYASTGRAAPTKTTLLARAIQDGLITPDDIIEYQSLAAEGGSH